jgi:hypothetical protein
MTATIPCLCNVKEGVEVEGGWGGKVKLRLD